MLTRMRRISAPARSGGPIVGARADQHRAGKRRGIGDRRAGAVAEAIVDVGYGAAAQHADHEEDRIGEPRGRADADNDGERDVGVDGYERDEAHEQHVGVVHQHRAGEGAGGAAALGAEPAGRDRGGDEQKRDQRRRRGAEQDVEFVPVFEHGGVYLNILSSSLRGAKRRSNPESSGSDFGLLRSRLAMTKITLVRRTASCSPSPS